MEDLTMQEVYMVACLWHIDTRLFTGGRIPTRAKSLINHGVARARKAMCTGKRV